MIQVAAFLFILWMIGKFLIFTWPVVIYPVIALFVYYWVAGVASIWGKNG